jgi:hypothetical protein
MGAASDKFVALGDGHRAAAHPKCEEEVVVGVMGGSCEGEFLVVSVQFSGVPLLGGM